MNAGKWGLVGALFLTGCSGGDPVDIGNDEVTGEKLQDYEGSWVGFVEAFEFADGSDRVRLSLEDDGVGTITLGESISYDLKNPETWPIPNPNLRSYPEEIGDPLIGFAYSALETRVEAKRIRFEFDIDQAEGEWCELQTPIPTENSAPAGYGCVHDWSYRDLDGVCTQFNAATQTDEPIDCGKLHFCIWVCSCAADGCTGPDYPELNGRFDARLEDIGELLVGTLFVDQQSLAVRLTRTD
jgi:hypothetical protein